MPDGRSSSTWPGARVTSTTATSATTIPTTTSRSGMPSVTNPTTTGMTAARTPVVGRDDTHPADGEAAVERGDADDAGDARRDGPAEVGALREPLAAGEADGEREDEPDELRAEDDAEQRRAPGERPAAEVAGAPGERRDEPEQDDRRARARERQAGATTSGSTWSSTAVGPSSTTTESASAS